MLVFGDYSPLIYYLLEIFIEEKITVYNELLFIHNLR